MVNNAGIATTLDLSFRALRRSDFERLALWLAEPQVAYWWNHEVTPEALERDFGPAVDGTEPGEVCVASLDGEPFGVIQRYEIAAHPEYMAELEPLVPIALDTLSIDYFIGEPALRGRGLATAMIVAFTAHARDVVVPVSAGNSASWRALERAGFRRVAEGELEPDNPAESRAHVIYRLTRDG